MDSRNSLWDDPGEEAFAGVLYADLGPITCNCQSPHAGALSTKEGDEVGAGLSFIRWKSNV